MRELRKVQRTPTGTFFVCLPKSWAEEHGLKKGTLVALDETGEGKLLIDPKYDAEQLPRVATLSAGPYLSRQKTVLTSTLETLSRRLWVL